MDEHGYHDLLHEILKKQEATITALSIVNQSLNHLASVIGADVAKMKESSDKLQAAIAANQS